MLLATVIGLPADARDVLAALRDANPGEDVVSFLRSHGGHRLADLIETIRKDIPVHGELATYQEWGRTVARFSFETYALFLSG